MSRVFSSAGEGNKMPNTGLDAKKMTVLEQGTPESTPPPPLFKKILACKLSYDTDMVNASDWNVYQENQYCFNNTSGIWYRWNVSHWEQDTAGTVKESIKKYSDWIETHAREQLISIDSPEFGRLQKKIKKLRNVKGAASCLESASTIPGIATSEQYLDANPQLLNFANGTFDLDKNDFYPHKKQDFITKVLGYKYDPQAFLKPHFDKFMQQTFKEDASLINHVLEYMSMCLSGIITEQVFQFWYGTGANGKSVLTELLTNLLSCYAYNLDFNSLVDNAGNADRVRQEKSRLKGMRVVSTSEIGEGKKLNEQTIKDLTSNDTLSARELYGKAYNYKPTHHLIMIGNHHPRIAGSDYAIKRRVQLIPFDNTVEKADQIPHNILLENFRGEFPAIMNALILRYQALQKNKGMFTDIPETVLSHTKDFFAAQDIIANWISDCCQIAARFTSKGKDLYQSYKTYCIENGFKTTANNAFSRKLNEYIDNNCLQVKSYKAHNNLMEFHGIGVTTPCEDQKTV